MKLILASRSPRRHDILNFMGIPFETEICVEPEIVDPNLSAEETVRTLALHKARFAQKLHPNDYILGSDTIVELNGEILGKPHTAERAKDFLSRMQGRMHTVYTGVALLHGSLSDVRCCKTLVRFCPMSDAEIDWYVQTGEPLDKAGAYGLQGLGSVFVDSIDGNYFNVIGLPAPLVYDMLKKSGFISEDRRESL